MMDRVSRSGFNPPSGVGDSAHLSCSRKFEQKPIPDDTKADNDKPTLGHIMPEDFTPDGKIPLIITSSSLDQIERLKRHIKNNFSSNHAEIKEELPVVQGFKMEVSADQFNKLMKTIPPDTGVSINKPITYPSWRRAAVPNNLSQPEQDVNSYTINSLFGISKIWEKGYTGKGVCVAVIDSGIYPHKDLKDKLKYFKDFTEKDTNPYDPNGHGTHVSGLIAGSGTKSAGKFKGVAPDVDLIVLRITNVDEAIKAIQWTIENKDKYGIKVLNMSLGDYPLKSYKDDPWAQAAEKAWDAGITVVVAAGNEGPNPGTISTPGTNPKVITVGCMDDRKTPEREDDILARNSSRGPTKFDGIKKPDIVAPGIDLIGPLAPGSKYANSNFPKIGDDYIASSGSSEATPVVTGLIALLLQANPDLSPDEIKAVLKSTASPYLPRAKDTDQGAGVIEPMKALEAVLEKKNAKKPAKQNDATLQMLLSEVNRKGTRTDSEIRNHLHPEY